jgi:hypothetical protein
MTLPTPNLVPNTIILCLINLLINEFILCGMWQIRIEWLALSTQHTHKKPINFIQLHSSQDTTSNSACIMSMKAAVFIEIVTLVRLCGDIGRIKAWNFKSYLRQCIPLQSVCVATPLCFQGLQSPRHTGYVCMHVIY